jgi:UDP-N-acetylmuramate--alanine ligase
LKQINQNLSKAALVTETNFEQQLDRVVMDGDVILMQGAGSIGQLAVNLMQKKLRETA